IEPFHSAASAALALGLGTRSGGQAVSGPIVDLDTVTVVGVRETSPTVRVPNFGTGLAGINWGYDCGEGNPIYPSTGNKVETELDFSSSGEAGLFLSRTYNHYWQGVGLFGRFWISNFDYKLTFGTTAINACYPRQGR